MKRPDFRYEVTRTGRTVRVDLTQVGSVTVGDAEAVVAAAEALVVDDEVEVVQLDGPAMDDGRPPKGMSAAIRELERLADRYGKRLIVSPI